MNPAELYHRVLSISPSTSTASDDDEVPYGHPNNYNSNGACTFVAAHLPPSEFIRRFGGGGAGAAPSARAGRLSPKSRHIAKRNERRERSAVLKKLRGMVGGGDDCNQLQIIEHVINRIRELQETLAVAVASSAGNDAPSSPPLPPSPPSSGGVSPAASLDSLSWASATDDDEETERMGRGELNLSAGSEAASDSALSASPNGGLPVAADGDVQRLIRQLSNVLSQFGAATQLRF